MFDIVTKYLKIPKVNRYFLNFTCHATNCVFFNIEGDDPLVCELISEMMHLQISCETITSIIDIAKRFDITQ